MPTKAAVALILAAIALAGVAAATLRPSPSAGVSRRSSAPPGGVVRRLVPIWDGDTFRVRKRNTELPPYRFSSASGPREREGWLQPHSNTNPNVDGVTIVDDPAGLISSTPPGGVRKVIKITTDERRAFAGEYVRTEIQGPRSFKLGDDRWVIAEVWIPPGTPTMPGTARRFWD